ncbi:hypothetical protein NC653_010877 [Populus alba x Populus x berolinensis]|uniref:Uncharacterized protein n=2 Tax=Populus alba x Populus x berolinensis TaxID=444605 RepID=A0AAD6W695_9ROSI|nr:hypothetical protein NC653_010877 [Populus alba x Populus x berolinensis]
MPRIFVIWYGMDSVNCSISTQVKGMVQYVVSVVGLSFKMVHGGIVTAMSIVFHGSKDNSNEFSQEINKMEI